MNYLTQEKLEELRRQRLEAAALNSGFVDRYDVAPRAVPDVVPDKQTIGTMEGELESSQDALERQRAMAQSLMDTPLPEGKTVGPSGIYVQNPYEGLSTAAQRIAGGLINRQANKAQKGVDGQKTALKAALGARQGAEDRGVLAREAEQRGRLDRQEARDVDQIDYQRGQDKLAITRDNEEIKRDSEEQAAQRAHEIEIENIKAAASARGRSGSKKTDGERTARFRQGAFSNALKDYKDLIADGFDPASFETWVERHLNDYDLTRWLSGDKTQKAFAAENIMREAVLRTQTGAAAPVSEKDDYIETLIPRVGESPEATEMKIARLGQFEGLLRELAGETDFDSMDKDEADALSKEQYLEAKRRLKEYEAAGIPATKPARWSRERWERFIEMKLRDYHDS